MPTYEYECNDCGYRFEAFQKMSDNPLENCPECGKKVRRILSSGLGISFKGSGFYVTDSSKKPPEKKKSGKADSVKSGSNG